MLMLTHQWVKASASAAPHEQVTGQRVCRYISRATATLGAGLGEGQHTGLIRTCGTVAVSHNLGSDRLPGSQPDVEVQGSNIFVVSQEAHRGGMVLA